MVTPSPFHGFGDRDEVFLVRVFGCGESVEMADGALGDHGFDGAGERAREGGGKVHGEAGGILDHLCVNYRQSEISTCTVILQGGRLEGAEGLVGDHT